MTIREALTAIKGIKPSQYDDETLVRWMSELDGRIWEDVLCRYWHGASRPEDTTVPQGRSPRPEGRRADREDVLCRYGEAARPALPYHVDTDMGRTLLAPFPHDDLYLKWLGAQIDYHNAEFERYNNGMVMFNAGWQAFADAWNREHMSRQDAYIKI